jgi:hypothetical protein
MNQRIKELASQCWDLRLDGRHFDQEQFAELIVRECAGVGYDAAAAKVNVSNRILEHFGVKE